MLRTALKPRWLGLLAVLLVLLVAFTFLGLWQLSVARDDGERAALEAATSQPAAPLDQVLQPHIAFPADASGRPVTATGTFDAAGQVLVVDRRLDGVAGSWVVTPLVVTGTGARVAVLRGFTTAATPPDPAHSEVTVTGTLAPGESPATDRDAALPAGQLGSLDLSRLVNVWPGDLYNAFVFQTAQQPAASNADGLQPVPPPPLPTGLTWRNAAYAVQWWVFGIFAAWMWWRMVRDDHRRDLAAEPPQPTPRIPAGAPTS